MLIRKFASINRHGIFSVVEFNRYTHTERYGELDDTVGGYNEKRKRLPQQAILERQLK
jgi:hypothetical protein